MSGVTVYIDANNNGQLDSGETSTTTDGSGNYSFTGLTAGTYSIAAVPAGQAFTSGAQSVMLPDDYTDTTDVDLGLANQPFSGLSASFSGSFGASVYLSWSLDSDYSGASFTTEIDRSTDGSSYSLLATQSSGTTSYTDTSLTPNTHYYYKVLAYSGLSFSTAPSGSADAQDPPADPSGLTATTISTSEVDLTIPAYSDTAVTPGTAAQQWYGRLVHH
jgi:hypothetical protein